MARYYDTSTKRYPAKKKPALYAPPPTPGPTGATSSPAPPPPAPAPGIAPPPTDPNRQSAIDSLIAWLASLPGTYNTRRKDLAAETSTGLVESGLFDSANYEGTTGEGGNITYRIVVGPNGRLYRQAFSSARDSFNARGLLGSSFMQRAQREGKQALDVGVAQGLRGFDKSQGALGEQQSADVLRGQQDISGKRTEYGDWQRAQPVAAPALPPAPNPVAPMTAGGPQPYAKPPGMKRPTTIAGWGETAPKKRSPLSRPTRRIL